MAKQSLAEIVKTRDRPPVIPLMGFPGIQVNGSSLKQNEFNWSVQFWTLFELVRRFQPDGMFTFMDLSVEANALGLPVRFPLDESPSVEYPVVEVQADLRRFYKIDVLADGRLHVFVETMRMMQRHLSMMRGGYVIGPYTLAALMMGATEAAIATIDNPDLLHETLRLTTHVITRYANALARAGAHVIAILEPSAVMLSPRQFRQYSGEYVKQIIEKMSAQPVLHICGNTNHLIDGMIATGAQGLSLDSLVDLPAIAADVPEDVVLIGNVSPTAVMVDETPAGVYATTRDLIERMAPYPNFILSTGCDLPPETPLANIQAFMDAGRGRPLCEREDGCIPLDETLFKERPEKILSTIVEAWR